MSKSIQKYEENEVLISKSTIKVGDEVTVSYSGLLVQSGADVVFAHIGYGEEWEGKEFIGMVLEDGIFSVTFKTTHAGVLNVSFKDSANNWDNNSGENYVFEVADKKTTARSTTKKVKDAEEKEAPAKEKTTSEKKATSKAATTKTTTTRKKTTTKASGQKGEAEKEKAPAKKSK